MTSQRTSAVEYVLSTGDKGASRLALLDRVYGRDCERTIRNLGLARGMRIADIGCGTGNTAFWFASQVGPTGEVVAADISAAQLAVARNAARTAGHHNIRFVEADAYALDLPKDSFDIVHCRLLLCHLERPLDAIREMVAVAKPGGLIVCCDLDVGGLLSFPDSKCYRRVRELITIFGRKRGVDYELGMKIPALLTETQLLHPDIALIHPVYLRGPEKRLWEQTFFEASGHIVKAGLTDDAELSQLATALAAVAADEGVAIAQSRMPICWAWKPQ